MKTLLHTLIILAVAAVICSVAILLVNNTSSASQPLEDQFERGERLPNNGDFMERELRGADHQDRGLSSGMLLGGLLKNLGIITVIVLLVTGLTKLLSDPPPQKA